MRPRIRSLKPEMWDDEKVVALSRDARLLFLALVTMADDEGRFRARRSTILGHAFPDDEDAPELIDGWVGEIREQGMVVFYIVDQTPYGAFRHWRRHQKINKPTPSDLPPPPDPKVVRDNRVRKQGGSTERNGSSPVGVREKDGSAHSSHAGSDPIRSDPIRSLCERLGAHLSRNDPKADPKVASERWHTDMRLLVADRDGDVAEVERIIDWCQADSFWRSNILCPGKLRKQFTQLILKAQSGQVVPLHSHLPEGQRPTPEWQAQVRAHLADQREPEWLRSHREGA